MNARVVWALARSCHPLPVAAVTLGTTALALGAGIGGRWPLVLATVLGNQLSVGLANDYLDRDLDRRAGRRDKPVAAGEVEPRVVAAVALASAVLAVGFSLTLGLAAAMAQLLMLAVAHAYNLWLKRTVFSVVPYAVAFGMVPLFVALSLGRQWLAPPCQLPPAVPGQPIPMCPAVLVAVTRMPALWATAAAALLGAGAHFTQALPDIEADLAAGVDGLPARLGSRWALAVAATCLMAAAALVLRGPGRGLGTPAAIAAACSVVATIGVLAVGLGGRPRLAFRLNVLAAFFLVAALLLSGTSILAPVYWA